MPRRNRYKKKRQRKGRRRNYGQSRGWERAVLNNPIQTRRLRFFNSSANYEFGTGFGYLVARDLINCVLGYSDFTASDQAVCIAQSVKLIEIKMYYCSLSTGLGNDGEILVLSWLGNRSPEQRITARGTLFKPASIRSRPKPNTNAAFWWSVEDPESYSTILCHFQCPANTIIDVTFQYAMDEASATGSGVCTVSDPGAAGIWYAALDNCKIDGTVYNLYLLPDGNGNIIITDPAPVKDFRETNSERSLVRWNTYVHHRSFHSAFTKTLQSLGNVKYFKAEEVREDSTDKLEELMDEITDMRELIVSLSTRFPGTPPRRIF